MSNRQPIRYGGRNLPRELTQLLLVCVGGVYWLLFGAQHQFLVGPGFILLAFVLSRRWRLTALAILVVLCLVACIWPVWLASKKATLELTTYLFEPYDEAINTYNPAGWLVDQCFDPASFNDITQYDDAGQITPQYKQSNRDLVFTYDPVGNRKSIFDNFSPVAWTTYTYDPKSRLTQDATMGTNTHTYDYTYDGNDNRLTSNETGALSTWTYDIANRMVTSCDLVAKQKGSATFYHLSKVPEGFRGMDPDWIGAFKHQTQLVMIEIHVPLTPTLFVRLDSGLWG